MKITTRDIFLPDFIPNFFKLILLVLVILGLSPSLAQTPILVKNVKVPFHVKELFPEPLKDNWQDKSILQVFYGKLSEKSFQQLKAAFSNSSQVTYDPKREYSLIDFLPPAAQSVVNHTLPVDVVTIELNTPSLQEYYLQGYSGIFELQTLSNCWNTAIEFLMSMHGKSNSFKAYLPSPVAFESFLSTGLKTSGKDLTIGDLIVYKSYSPDLGEEILEHVAVVIGENLVFEKTEPYGNSPFRIAKATTVFENLAVRVEEVGGELLEPVYYRFSKTQVKRVDSELIGALKKEGLSDIIAPLESHGIDTSKVYMGLATNISDKPVPLPQIVKDFPLTLNETNQRFEIKSSNFKNLINYEALLKNYRALSP